MTDHTEETSRLDDTLLRTLVEKVTEEAETHGYIRRRVDLVVWVGIAMLLLATAGVVVRLVNYYGLRADVLSRNEEIVGLSKTVSELTYRNNKLRAEVAIRDARFLSSKGVLKASGRLDDLLSIQAIVDGYALDELRNGAASEKTADDVRREVCDRLASRGFPCVP